jgi:integrase
MPRKARDERLNTRTVRLALKVRSEPYWRTIQEGQAIGYRRLAGGKAGTWIARHYAPAEGRHYEALGSADDMNDADGGKTLTFAQAQAKAQNWFTAIEKNAGRVVEPCTVTQAMENYLADYSARGGRALPGTKRRIAADIVPQFGPKLVNALTFTELKRWHQELANAPVRLRTKATASKHNVKNIDPKDAEGQRARRATANRTLTVLKAALSLAYREGRAPSDDAWRRVKPFAKADAPRIRFLTDAEAVRLVNACTPDLRRIVIAGLLTGARYGELAALRVTDLNSATATLQIQRGKGGRRTIPLTDEAVRFFEHEAAGKAGDALLLPHDTGAPWGDSHQLRPMTQACIAASITPAIGFHGLRHTFASRLLMKGVPMSVVAAALGNTEAICARHYAHLAPSYIANTIRQHAGGLDIVPDTNVRTMRPLATSG